MTPESLAKRAAVSRIVELVSILVSVGFGMALLVVAVSRIAAPVAIAPTGERTSASIAGGAVSAAMRDGSAARIVDLVPRGSSRSAATASTEKRSRNLADGRAGVRGGKAVHARIATNVNRNATARGVPKSHAERTTTVRAIAVGANLPVTHIPAAAPPAAVRSIAVTRLYGVNSTIAKRVAIAAHRPPAPPRKGASVRRGSRAAMELPEPPVGYDARPQFVGAEADAPLGNAAAVDGVRVRGRAIAPISMPGSAPTATPTTTP